MTTKVESRSRAPIERAELEKLVPHKGGMFLLDRFLDWDVLAGSFEAEAVASASSPFYDEGTRGVPVWVAFEYMAQGIAALSGIGRRETGGRPKIGFVMGLREFKAGAPTFPEGARVRVEARELLRDGPVVSFTCSAECCGAVTTAVVNAIETDIDP
jgi:predicted hotdog family 3-hydroxylacyl-ACP dehydratase